MSHLNPLVKSVLDIEDRPVLTEAAFVTTLRNTIHDIDRIAHEQFARGSQRVFVADKLRTWNDHCNTFMKKWINWQNRSWIRPCLTCVLTTTLQETMIHDPKFDFWITSAKRHRYGM